MLKAIAKFIDTLADKWGYWGPLLIPGGLLASALAWAAKTVEPIARLGWGAIVICGVALSCACLGAAAAVIWTWHRLRGPSPDGRKSAVDLPIVQKISDISPSNTPALLRLHFLGVQRAPTEIRSENILLWYVIWTGDVKFEFHGEGGKIPTGFEIPKTWAIYIIFERPIKFKQLIVEPAVPNFPQHEVKIATPYCAIITTFGIDPPAGMLDIYSR